MSSQQYQDYEEALREEEQLRDQAMNQAAQAGIDQAGTTKNASFLREYGDPDISSRPGADEFEQRVAAELSHHHLFGNIDARERERLQILNQALAMQFKAEFPKPNGVSSKCTGQFRKAITGEDKPILQPDMARQADSTLGEEGVRSQMQSQAQGASAWRGLTRIQSVAMTDQRGGDVRGSGGGGVLGRAKQFLFGGGD